MTDAGDEARFYALRTFRRDGTPVMTPVWAAFLGDAGYVLTGARTFKVRRLERTPRIEIAPSDYRGATRGEWRSGTATVADDVGHRRGIVLLRRKYGLQFRIFHAISALGTRRRTVGRPITVSIALDAEHAGVTAEATKEPVEHVESGESPPSPDVSR